MKCKMLNIDVCIYMGALHAVMHACMTVCAPGFLMCEEGLRCLCEGQGWKCVTSGFSSRSQAAGPEVVQDHPAFS